MSKNEPEEIIAVEFVNCERNIINFVKDEHKFGFFHFDPKTLHPKVGDLLKVKFSPKTKDDKLYKPISIEPAGKDDTCAAVKNFKGKLLMENKNGFGFVEEVFIYPQLVKKFNLTNGQEVEGKAIYAFDKKKNTWGWKVFWIVE